MEWEAVYNKSLLMAEKFGFYDYSEKEIDNVQVKCLTPTKEREFSDGFGWKVIGIFPECPCDEAQFTPAFFGKESYDGPEFDILRFYVQDEPIEAIDEHSRLSIWNDETAGDYIMALLAIGCMAEQMLGVQALIHGNITYRVCIEAAKMATEALGEEIKPPVSCRLDDLYERISKFHDLDEYGKLNILKNIYLGIDYNEFGEFQKKHFSEESITKYWGERFKKVKFDTLGFIKNIKEYFCENDDLKRFCELTVFDKSDPEKCTKLIRTILECSMHVNKNECCDLKYCLEHDRFEPRRSSAFFSRLVCKLALYRFIPLVKIRKVFTDCFGDVLNVNEVIDAYLEENYNSLEPIENFFGALMEKDTPSENYEVEYDIYHYKDLPYYKPNCTLAPELTKSIEEAFKVYNKSIECDAFNELMILSGNKLFEILVRNFEDYLFTYDQWKVIHDEIKRDKETFRRYCPMACVTHHGNTAYLIRAFVTDNDFWNYCCETFSTEDGS